MKTRKQSQATEPPGGSNGQLQNKHEDNSATARTTLLQASRQHVSKLLDRVHARGAAAPRKQHASSENGSWRGKRKAPFEGESGLFYQRRSSKEDHFTPDDSIATDPLICGAPASTVDSLLKSTLTECDILSPICERNSKEESAEGGDLLSNQEQVPALRTEQKPYATEMVKEEPDGIEECFFEEEDFGWEVVTDTCSQGVDVERSIGKRETGDLTIEVEEEETIGRTRGTQSGSRRARRATASDKELAELIHKAHLLCLLARGGLIDAACDDSLLQASLLSIVPSHIKFIDSEKLTAAMLQPLVTWFQNTFRVVSEEENAVSHKAGEGFSAHLRHVLGRLSGTNEEVAALSVALLRALGFTTRFMKVLDVVSLKPDMNNLMAPEDCILGANVENASQMFLVRKVAEGLGHILAQRTPQYMSPDSSFSTSKPTQSSGHNSMKAGSPDFVGRREQNAKDDRQSYKMEGQNSSGRSSVPSSNMLSDSNSKVGARGKGKRSLSSTFGEVSDYASGSHLLSDVTTQETELRPRRKGDQEFELQLAMAIEATAVSSGQKAKGKCGMRDAESLINMKDAVNRGTSEVHERQEKSNGDSMHRTKRSKSTAAVWSRKMGPLLHWAEVFCGGEGVNGKWVHVDAGNGILDDASMVEGAAAACKFPLRYVVAFAGSGAKDVTSRYVTMWSSVAPLRVDVSWWSSVLHPLKKLEAAATSGLSSSAAFQKHVSEAISNIEDEKQLSFNQLSKSNASSSKDSLPRIQSLDRGSLEDVELEVRTHTEPLPTNQQAYRNHHLYVLEKWLTKYQILRPRGPVLGYCGGHEVYPRTCIQNLHTAERWLAEGFKVRDDEEPAKVVMASRLANKASTPETADTENSGHHKTRLYGKWQTEPWTPPPAVNGIVPKNQRGQVDVWSEKCIPQGTVHLRLPWLPHIAKELGIDFAPAMVGFEIRNRRSVPVFDGIVVCEEFKEVLLAAYAEEEDRRTALMLKKREDQAMTRWQHLLRTISTRLRLRAAYETPDHATIDHETKIKADEKATESLMLAHNILCENMGVNTTTDLKGMPQEVHKDSPEVLHEHTFSMENQSYNEETGLWTKSCSCGFTLQIEEM